MPSPISLKAGAPIGAYQISKVVATTHYGVLYRATSIDGERTVKIQEFLPRELATRTRSNARVRARKDREHAFEEALTLFLQEARILAQIHDPYVARVHEYTEVNGTAYLIMEYDPGQSLAKYLSTHPNAFSETEFRNLFVPLLKGLRVIHGANLIHRDITPTAIYLRRNGPPMLTWFGACHRAAKIETGLSHRVTQGYSPIELYQESPQLRPSSDLYSLGAVMYRCIAGAVPVDAIRRVTAIAQQEEDPLVPAMELGSGNYSSSLLGNIDWMLKPMWQERPDSAGAILGILTEPAPTVAVSKPHVTRSLPLPIIEPRPAVVPRASTSRRPLIWVIGGAASIALTLLGWQLFKQRTPEQAENSLTEQTQTSTTTGDVSAQAQTEPLASTQTSETTTERTADASKSEPELPLAAPETVLPDLPPNVPDTVNFSRTGDNQRAAQYREIFRHDQESKELLQSARDSVKNGDLEKAVAQSQRVLALDSGNTDAKEIIAQIADQLLAQAKQAFADREIDKAIQLLTRIDIFAPKHFGLTQLRQQVADFQAEQREVEETRRRAELDKQVEIKNLLSRAADASQQGRYLEPPGNNALEYLRAVLTLDPHNSAAQEGIEKVTLAFLERANKALATDDFDRAATELATATAIKPEYPAIGLLKEQLDARRRHAAFRLESKPAAPPAVTSAAPATKTITSKAQKEKEAKESLQRGIEAYYAGSYDKASRLLTDIARQGNTRAQSRVGMMYYLGRGAPKNRTIAEEWIRKALPEVRRLAQQGVAWAQADLGSLYEDGLVVEQDAERAVRWYQRAAEQGYAGAQTNLGVMYAKGIGVEINIFQAIRWLERAAAQGDRVARENLLTLRNEE